MSHRTYSRPKVPRKRSVETHRAQTRPLARVLIYKKAPQPPQPYLKPSLAISASPAHPGRATASSATSYEYNVADNTDYSHDTVVAACLTEEEAVAWCRRVGLLANGMACLMCANAMRLTGWGHRQRWRCGRSSCRLELSTGANSFFFGSHAKLRQLVWLCVTQVPARSATEFTAASPTTITQ
ncbi:hypothetical protein PR002_g10549 [Phytophthora rubi]|uniref:Uncharacterized protein n=1 Tax=Phytophthora rubi TaxID=129364 RepID=A0A6A3MCH0_9STRA|nr:hypothetical protein PR002_g10549 [Phytophthora rubi]